MKTSYKLIDKNTIQKTTVEYIDLKSIRDKIASLEVELLEIQSIPDKPNKQEYSKSWSGTGLSKEQVDTALMMLNDYSQKSNIEAKIEALKSNINRLLKKCK